jgi:Undecaprenyl-phosphate glucose phosphotransferase
MSIPAERCNDLAAPRLTPWKNLSASCLVSDLMPLVDGLTLWLGAQLSTMLYMQWMTATGAGIEAIRGSHTIMAVSILAAFILYDRRFGSCAGRIRPVTLLRPHAARFLLLAAVAVAVSVLSAPRFHVPSSWMAVWLGIGLLFTSLARILAAAYLSRLQLLKSPTELVAVVGTGVLADRLIQALQKSRNRTVELLGVFDDASVPGILPATRVGTVAELLALGRTRRIDWILLAKAHDEERHLASLVQRLKVLSVPIGLCPQHIGLDVPFHSIDLLDGRLPVSLLVDRPIRRWDAVLKATEDFVGGAIITLLLLPVLAAIALAVRLSGPGPIIFRQRRHTLNNDEFDVFKFRTMHWVPAERNADLQQTTRMDARVTRVGRFLRASSLDELPQLFNVLKGEMSLVGPRPHAVNMRTEAKLGSEITDLYSHRHRVKPGMTGWSQVNGARGATETTEQLRRRVELDLYYIENWSVLLDIRILLLTLRTVVKQTNAF